ncbi:hypothetical protein KBD45_01825 [Candidatus Dojkabacteria bacterium]|nr:hypothetical protein [Candidatus Dojkabacteria bacterium]
MMTKQTKPVKTRLMDKTYGILIKVSLIIAIPAVSSYFVGKYLEDSYQIHPVFSLVVGLIITWAILFRMFINISRETKARKIED